jgi:hypothetical protein
MDLHVLARLENVGLECATCDRCGRAFHVGDKVVSQKRNRLRGRNKRFHERCYEDRYLDL